MKPKFGKYRDESYTVPEKEWKYKDYNCKVHFYEKRWRCGYVEIPKDHPCFLVQDYEDFPIDVHGGLTYGGHSRKDNKNWIGFDCRHCDDVDASETDREGHFWLLDEVMKETERMVDQLEELGLLDCAKEKIRWFPDWFTDNFKLVPVTKEGTSQ